jgi:hypothetical protein
VPLVSRIPTWRGKFRKDSLFVRARWEPTKRIHLLCGLHGVDDTVSIGRKYLECWIENSAGQIKFRDQVSGDEFGFCCDGLAAEGAPWQKGLVIRMDAWGWGCEPAGDCEEMRYVFLGNSGAVARSGWTRFAWDPAKDDPIGIVVTEGCIEYPMPGRARVRGAEIVFEPILPADAKEGDLLERELVDELSAYCPRAEQPPERVTVDLFPTAGSKVPDRLVVGATSKIEILSAVVRVERASDGRLTTRLNRVLIRVDGRRGYASPASMTTMGFRGF